VAVPTLVEFQQGIDEKLGTGVVSLDDATYVQVVAHEGFHAFTMTAIGGMDNLPDFGPEVDPQRAVELLATIPDLYARYAAEGKALRDGITAKAEEDALRAGTAFLQVRRSRHAGHPDLVAFEQTIEWTEGLARYADVSLMQLAGSPDYTGAIHYPNSAETWQEFLAQLSDPASIPTGIRDRYAILGAGEAFLLDRLMPDWKAKAIPGKTALEELLAEAMTPEPLRSFRVETVELAGEWLTVAVADRPEQWKQGLSGIADLGALDGLLFSFPGDVTTRFWMKDALIPLDAAFFAGDGSLISVMRMELCAQDSCPTYGPDHPFRWVLESPAGRLTWLPAQARLVARKK
jgi:uncharacterized membrane protein (UPF0127 family)